MATVIDSKEISTDVVASARSSTSRTRRPASRSSTRSSAPPRPIPQEAKLSNESPVGRALIGHKRNEVVAVQVPRGPGPQAQDHEDRRRPQIVSRL